MACEKLPSDQPHELFHHISDPSDGRYVASSTMVSNPFNGLCLGKNIITDHAWSPLSEQANAADAEPSFHSFERSETLHTVQTLSAMKIEICEDSPQACFDAFCCFSSLHFPKNHIGWLGKIRSHQWSQRQLLSNATSSNFDMDQIVQIISKDRRLGHVDASADSSKIGGTTIRRGKSDSSDGDITAPHAGFCQPPAWWWSGWSDFFWCWIPFIRKESITAGTNHSDLAESSHDEVHLLRTW